ncbi:hypothetical protein O4H52_08035 [Sphingomonadaceae bacterium G21617-S1]|nr:hypothetical protein [Sphingomonadaceae bacterium G21617-S1]
MAELAPASEPVTIEWPGALDGDLLDILGRPNFACAGFIPIYRLAGFDIPKRAENEQAFFIHRCILAWAKHGAGWHAAMIEEMEGFARAAGVLAGG